MRLWGYCRGVNGAAAAGDSAGFVKATVDGVSGQARVRVLAPDFVAPIVGSVQAVRVADMICATTGPASSVYNITIEFKGTWNQANYEVFVAAANKLT